MLNPATDGTTESKLGQDRITPRMYRMRGRVPNCGAADRAKAPNLRLPRFGTGASRCADVLPKEPERIEFG